MAKIEVSKVADILRKNHLEPAVMRRILEEIARVTEAASAAEEEKPPPVKKQFVILVSDPEGEMPDTDFAGWIVQLPDDASPLSTAERIEKAAFDFNATRRGRALPVGTVGEALETVPAQHFKDVELWVKTKTPVQVLKTDNVLPKR